MAERVLESYEREFLKLLGEGFRLLAEEKKKPKGSNKTA